MTAAVRASWPMALNAASSKEDSQTRGLYNALRTGDHGVSFEALMREVYFLQHRNFTLFDAREAFHSSTGANERYLIYRDFQHAIIKLARARSYNALSTDSKRRGSDAAALLLEELVTRQHAIASGQQPQMDTLRLQMAQRSVLEVLELHLPKLIQSFQLYGKENAIASDEDTSSTISLDGFLDFLNAYFEYEEYFSFQQIEQMVNELKDAFAPSLEPELGPQEMYFAHFVELFCRVASGYHNQLLVREGAQLRRVVESCRLEFSIEILLQHMNIKILRDDSSPHASTSSSGTRRQQRKSYMEPPRPVGETGATEPDMEGLTLEIDTRIGDETRTFESVIDEIRIHLEAFERANAAINKRTKRVQSMLFARLPPRKVSPRCDDPVAIAIRDGYYGISEKIPLVTLIRELMTPPPLPTRVLTKLESAMTYQNMGQYHMALGVLEDCKARYRESSNDADIGLDDVEVQVFFHLMIASVLDSARNDFQALLHYYKALKVADTLTLHHPGRVLVKSCLGCMLYYAGEIGLAKKCHQHVLDARRLAVGDEHIDTATAMNNLACCFSQDPTGTAMEEAFLLLKNAKRIYLEAFGASHPRVEVMMRNLEHVNVCQRMIVVDPVGAVERGEYAHIIPGSRFQIQALVPNVALKKSTAKTGKKKKKGAKQKK